MTVLIAIETAVLVVLTIVVAGLLRAYATVLRRLHQLDGGGAGHRPDLQFRLTPAAPSAAPEFGEAHDIVGESLTGEVVSARVADVDNDTLLLFLSSGCASCEQFWTELRDPGAMPANTRVLVVPQSAEDESVDELRRLATPDLDVVLSTQAWRDYEVPGSPHVVYVNGRSGRVRGEGTGQSLDQVRRMLARSTGDARLAMPQPAGPTAKSARDTEHEAVVDRELLAAGILPGDPRLYEMDEP
jgi:hypothetical protein